jgi:hypothetical protein
VEIEDPFAARDAAEDATADLDEDLDEVMDLSDVEAVAGRPVLPSGTYDAWVKAAEFKRSKAGNKMFSIQFLIRQPDEEEYSFPLFFNPTVSPKQIGQTKHQLNVITGGQIDWSQFKGSVVADQLVGNYCRLRLTQKDDAEYGKQNNVRDVLPASDAMGGFAQ